MRKKLFAILMITAMITAFGPLELFAGTEDNDAPSDTSTEVVVDTPEDGDEDVDTTPAEEPTRGENGEKGDGDTPEEPTEPEFQGITKLENIEANPTDKTVALSWTVKEGEELAEGETLTIWNGSELVDEITDITKTSTTIEGLERLTKYTFVFKVGDRVVSDDVTFTTTTTAINLEKLSSYKSVYLRWDEVEGANYYVLKYQGNGHEFDDEPLYEGPYTGEEVKHTGDFWMYDTYTTSNNGYYMRDSYLYKIEAYDEKGGTLLGEGTVRGDAVKTLYYELTFKKAATLTSHSGGSVKHTFKKGQKVYARDFDGGRFIFDYKCPDGKVRTYYTLKVRVNAAIWGKHIYSAYRYTGEEATRFVNDRGLTSNTKYLIWVNPYTQKDYIFTGSKGNWKLVTGPMVVSTGKASKPTATGSTNINRKMKSQHGVPTWSVTRYFSLHGKQSSWVLGWPRSGACVRHYNSNAKWIYNNCPLKTRVFVY
ncbi:MAG: L,D-transpeptidase [Mogibacterium sp.]|nr:L,D-transpeptidase [Mogibacterium sp.]